MAATLQETRIFIFNLLGKRRRRLDLLRRLHQSSFSGDNSQKATPHEKICKFMLHLLYIPLQLELTSTHMNLWPKNFTVPFNWLTPDEVQFIARLMKHRDQLFKEVNQCGSELHLRKFVYNGKLWDIEWRRELLRDYIFDVFASCDAERRVSVHYLLLSVVQQLLLNPSGEKKIDPFLVDLHHVLQNNGVLSRLCTK